MTASHGCRKGKPYTTTFKEEPDRSPALRYRSSPISGEPDLGDVVGDFIDSNGLAHGFLREHDGSILVLDVHGLHSARQNEPSKSSGGSGDRRASLARNPRKTESCESQSPLWGKLRGLEALLSNQTNNSESNNLHSYDLLPRLLRGKFSL
jgi:hypothetical protein